MTTEERRRIASAKRYIEIMRSLDPTQFRPDFAQRIDEQEEEILARERALDKRDQERIAEIRAEAWDEGARAGLDTGLDIAEIIHQNKGWLPLEQLPPPPTNPYRKETS